MFVVKPNLSSSPTANVNNGNLYIASFNPPSYSRFIGGINLVLVNPTNEIFANLHLAVKVDDFNLTIPDSLLLTYESGKEYEQTQFGIGAHQNLTIWFSFTNLDISIFSPHAIKFYVSENTFGNSSNPFGNVINGQSFVIPQQEVCLQILGYSTVEHDQNTWHAYYNGTYEDIYKNDQPNFCQKYYHLQLKPLYSDAYYWYQYNDLIDENYFNITLYNNSSFAVGNIEFYGGFFTPDGALHGANWQAPADAGFIGMLESDILQPNQTYELPVPLSLMGEPQPSSTSRAQYFSTINNVTELSTFFPSYVYASGDFINNQGNSTK